MPSILSGILVLQVINICDYLTKTLTTQHLIQYQLLIQDQICPVSDIEIDKSDQLTCNRYKNQNVLA